MKIGIIAAMRKEIDLLLPLVENKAMRTVAGVEIIDGKIGSHDVCVMECGIGKVNSALNANTLIEAEHPDLLVNSGVAGGADLAMGICDVLVADSVAYHDVWCGPGTEYGAAYGLPPLMRPDARMLETAHNVLGDSVKYGLICSGDKFITAEEEIREIKSHFPQALAVDMESASIAQTASLRGVPFLIVRAISDTPGSGENISQYEDFWTRAPQSTFHALVSLLRAL